MAAAVQDLWLDGDPSALESGLAESSWLLGSQLGDDGEDPAEELSDAGPTVFAGRWTVAETLLEVVLAGPGPSAINLLSGVAGRVMTLDQRLTVVELWQAQQAWMDGQQNLALTDVAGVAPPAPLPGQRDGEEWLYELALALDSSESYTHTKVDVARLLATTLVATGDLLRAGAISSYKAWVVADRLGDLDPVLARQVEAAILPRIGDPVRLLRRRIARAVLKADPGKAAKAHQEGRDARRVYVETEEREPGLLGLQAYLPPAVAIAVDARLTEKAHDFAKHDQVAFPDQELCRSADQRRADALAWFILGPDPQDSTRFREPNVSVQVTADLPTLLHLRDHPGELGRFGLIPADVARELAADGAWQLMIHEPVTGYLLNQGDQVYTPSRRLARFVRARDVHCRFPGSTRPAADDDLDHGKAFREGGGGGDTSAENLAALARRPHRAKTFGDYTPKHLGHGVIEWTMPSGRKHITTPHDYRGDPDGDDDP